MADKPITDGFEHNLEATLRYAKLLHDQPGHLMNRDGLTIRDLALLSYCLAKHELDTIRGNGTDSTALEQTTTVLLSSAASHLGFKLVPAPKATDLKYYAIKYVSPKRSEFVRRIALLSEIPVEKYLDAVEQPMGEVTRLDVRSLTETEWQETPERKKRSIRLSPEEEKLLKQMNEAGIIKVFSETLAAHFTFQDQPLPIDMGRFFLSYLYGLTSQAIPEETRNQFCNEFGGQVQFLQNHGVVMVLCDGEIRRFIPRRVLISTRRTTSFNLGDFHVERKTALSNWNHSKFGYVPADQHIFFETLRHSIGNRGRTMRDIPICPSLRKV